MSLRLTIVVLACIAALSAAQIFASCPSISATNDFYGALSSNCSAYASCAQTRCTCFGGTAFNAATNVCTLSTSGKTCAIQGACQAQFISCLNLASNGVSCLSSLKIAVMGVISGNNYNSSTLQTACQAATCTALNVSVGSNCTLSTAVYPTVCVVPSISTPAPANGTSIPTTQLYTADMTISGNWGAVVNSSVATTAVLKGCTTDLLNTSLAPYGPSCNKLRLGSGIISFSANAANNDPVFAALVTQVAALGTSVLKNTQSAFFANGGTGNFTLLSLVPTNNFGLNTTTPSTPTPTKGAASVTVILSVFVAVVLSLFA